MIKPTLITWILVVFGAITFLPLMFAQLIMIIKPHHQKTKDVIISKNSDWRDQSHFKYSLAFAWADCLVLFPLFLAGTICVIIGFVWAYFLWIILAVLSIYFSIIFWVLEREFSLPENGKLAYFTYIWGFFLYWGLGAFIYSILQIVNV